ncbi:MAG: methyltransferase domain-containing protein [Planctomycetaceae bacterium]
MKPATYTPGHSQNATEFMARRTIESHGEFFLPYLTPGVAVLDCGCGPGSITLSIANRIGEGRVVGIDFGESQIDRANKSVKEHGILNATFQTADCDSLPFEDASFDCVFSNALLEHLTDPVRALREMLRVLKPGGVIGVSSPDWSGFVLAPPSEALTAAVAAYTTLQSRNGGDVNVGRKLGTHLTSAGFVNCQMSARYEVYPSLPLIGEYLALQLERAGDSTSADTFRSWSQQSGGMFAQCWVSCLAHAPTPNSAFKSASKVRSTIRSLDS